MSGLKELKPLLRLREIRRELAEREVRKQVVVVDAAEGEVERLRKIKAAVDKRKSGASFALAHRGQQSFAELGEQLGIIDQLDDAAGAAAKDLDTGIEALEDAREGLRQSLALQQGAERNLELFKSLVDEVKVQIDLQAERRLEQS